MLLKLLIFTLAAYTHTQAINDDKPKFKWPSKYSFDVTKYHVASGLVEDIKVWHKGKQSRVDYNNGAVKYFYTEDSNGHQKEYEILPQTTTKGDTKLVCWSLISKNKDDKNKPYSFLPNVDYYKEIGTEFMNGKNCTKFFLEVHSKHDLFKKTIWAFCDDEAGAWIPTRYEREVFNTYHGSNMIHNIWNFENYDSKFDEKQIFKQDELSFENCIRHYKHDDAVTKHLHFIDPDNEEHVDHVFKAFKEKYSKRYAHEAEHKMRRSIFKRNLRLIRTTNLKNLTYKLAVNQFSDRTPQEMKRYMGLQRRPNGKVGTEKFPYNEQKLKAVSKNLPPVYDLRLLGVISPVQNQGDCGSCWAFGSTSAVEGAIARDNGGQLMRLSTQALVDCAWEFGATGCDGGSDSAAYEWIMKYGLPTIAEYGPYKIQDGYCNIKNMTKSFKIRGFVDVTPNSVEALKVALVNHGPISVSIHANDSFFNYDGGIFYGFDCSSAPKELNHEITLVGYGEQYGDTYWIVKNSWGPEWGIDGYMHIMAKDNNCGIMTQPTYVIV